LLQSSMEKSEDSSLMQMMSKLNKRSHLAEDDACLDESLEADHASMLQHHDFASAVRVRSRKDEDVEASASFFECEEDDHTSLLQSSMEKSEDSSLMQMISALRKRLPIVKDDVCPESIEADHASMLQHFDLSRRIRARSDDGGNASEVCGDCSEGDGASFLQTSVATNEAFGESEDSTSLLQSAVPSGLRVPARHGHEEDASAGEVVETDAVAELFGSAVPSYVAKPIATVVSQPALESATAQPAPELDAFELLDLDRDGQVTRQEIAFQLGGQTDRAKMLNSQGETALLQTGGFVESDAASAILASFDMDGGGTVSREEYDLQQYEAVQAQRRLEMDALRDGGDRSEDPSDFLS